MKALIQRADAIAQRARAKTAAKLAGSIRAAVRGVQVEAEPSAVVLSGRGLMRRWLTDPALRFAAGGWR